jgi:DNA-binding response OmpR family regulator
MVKPFSIRELVSRIRALIRRSYGEFSQSSRGKVGRFGNLRIDYGKMKVFKEEEELMLTPLEFKLLVYMIDHADMPLTRDRILDSVWGNGEYYGEDRTVDVHIRHLREKLEDDPSEPVYLQTVRGVGYKFSLD